MAIDHSQRERKHVFLGVPQVFCHFTYLLMDIWWILSHDMMDPFDFPIRIRFHAGPQHNAQREGIGLFVGRPHHEFGSHIARGTHLRGTLIWQNCQWMPIDVSWLCSNLLVGGFNPSETYGTSIGMIIPNIWENKPVMFQSPPTSYNSKLYINDIPE